tara:strand:- start:19835 stop:20197 length:363 start_codon:yes stop_codon:yes gene_type:complete
MGAPFSIENQSFVRLTHQHMMPARNNTATVGIGFGANARPTSDYLGFAQHLPFRNHNFDRLHGACLNLQAGLNHEGAPIITCRWMAGKWGRPTLAKWPGKLNRLRRLVPVSFCFFKLLHS